MSSDDEAMNEEPSARAPRFAESEVLPPKPTGRSKLIWVVLALAVAVVAVYRATSSGGVQRAMGRHHKMVGTSLPALELAPCAHASEPLSAADLQGKVTVLNFWGTWCPPCLEEMPQLLAIRQRCLKSTDFSFLSVSVSMSGDDRPTALAPDVMTYSSEMGTTWPVYCDPDFKTRLPLLRAAQFEDLVYPMTIVLDRKAVIRGLWIGFQHGDEEQVEQLVRDLLSETKA